MGKVKYKEPSKGIRSMVEAAERSARSSIGHDGNVEEYYKLRITSLVPYSEQAREIFDEKEINDLADTIKVHGILNPLVVVKSVNNPGSYEIISGERRFRAAQKIGIEFVPCIILGDSKRLPEIALIDNMQRAGLHPIEIGMAFSKLCKNNPHKQHQEIAHDIGVSKSKFSQYLRLADFLPDVRKWLLENKQASLRSLRAIDTNVSLEEIKQRKKNTSKGTILRVELIDGNLNISTPKLIYLNDESKKELKEKLFSLLSAL